MSSQEAETNGQVNIADIDNLGAVLNRINDRIAELEAQVDELREELHQYQQDGEHPPSLRAVWEHAQRKGGDDGSMVYDYDDIEKIAGVSHQTAYNYMSQWPEQYDFVENHQTPSGLKRIRVDTTLSTPFRTE